MTHQLYMKGFGVGIRPAELEDSEFILALRSDLTLGRYLGSFSGGIEDQRKWMAAYMSRPDEYYFIIEYAGAPVGTIGLYNFARDGNGITEAEWGRWLVKRDSPVGPISVLHLFCTVFDVLGIDRVFCQTVAENHSVVAFHDRYSMRVGCRQSTVFIDGQRQNVIFHEVRKSDWHRSKSILTNLALLTAFRLGTHTRN